MKTIGKIKLSQLSKAELEARQKNFLKGGQACVCAGKYCGCMYSGNKHPDYFGGSTTMTNMDANQDNNLSESTMG